MNVYEKYREAGTIAKDALELGIKHIKEGQSYNELAERVEQYIEENANLSFPVNISVNTTAAHYTPSPHKEDIFKRGDLVKLDIGTHVGGYIGDTAKTIEIGTNNYRKLIESAEKALENAISIIKAGIEIGEISKVIQNTIHEYNFKPIKNLQGHSVEQYKLHAGISIPNFYIKNKRKLTNGQVIAVEPFATNGKGMVKNMGFGGIYRLNKALL